MAGKGTAGCGHCSPRVMTAMARGESQEPAKGRGRCWESLRAELRRRWHLGIHSQPVLPVLDPRSSPVVPFWALGGLSPPQNRGRSFLWTCPRGWGCSQCAQQPLPGWNCGCSMKTLWFSLTHSCFPLGFVPALTETRAAGITCAVSSCFCSLGHTFRIW